MGEEDKYRKVLLLESRGKGRKRGGRYSVSVFEGKRRRGKEGWMEGSFGNKERERRRDGWREGKA